MFRTVTGPEGGLAYGNLVSIGTNKTLVSIETDPFPTSSLSLTPSQIIRHRGY